MVRAVCAIGEIRNTGPDCDYQSSRGGSIAQGSERRERFEGPLELITEKLRLQKRGGGSKPLAQDATYLVDKNDRVFDKQDGFLLLCS